MSFKDFRVVENCGKGSFASVYKVIRKSDNKIYAMKRVKIGKMSKKEISDALNEIRFLASIRHKNVVGFLESFLENNETELCIVMEYCGCGDLLQKVERYKRRKQHIEENVIWRYLIQALKALQYLHEKGICHRDIKAANCFLAEDGSLKLGDMNVSKKLNRGHCQTQIGTPYYMSPEIWNNRPYDASSDIWALGCMVYELCALKPPFTANDFPQLKKAINSGKYQPMPQKYSSALHRTVASMLRHVPKERPTAEHMLRTPDLSSKLQLDEGTAFNENKAQHARQLMLQTILVPQNLRKLSEVMPKPCYPDRRPNSPTAWPVHQQQSNGPPPPPCGTSSNTSVDTHAPANIQRKNQQRTPLIPVSDPHGNIPHTSRQPSGNNTNKPTNTCAKGAKGGQVPSPMPSQGTHHKYAPGGPSPYTNGGANMHSHRGRPSVKLVASSGAGGLAPKPPVNPPGYSHAPPASYRGGAAQHNRIW